MTAVTGEHVPGKEPPMSNFCMYCRTTETEDRHLRRMVLDGFTSGPPGEYSAWVCGPCADERLLTQEVER